MKKLFLCLLFLSVFFYCFANNVTATGYGKTAAEAQDNALGKLSERIFGTSVSSFTTTMDSDSTSGKTYSSFSKSVNSLSFGNLLAVEYTKAAKLDKSSFEVTAFISESSAQDYVNALKSLSQDILAEYKKSTKNAETEKIRLQNLLVQVQKFNNYRQVLSILKPSEILPDLPINETYKSLSDKLESIYTELINNEEQKKNSTSSASSLSKIQKQIELLKNEQETVLSTSNQSMIEQQEMYMQRLRENITGFIENSVNGSALLAGGYSIESDLDTVIKAIEKYNKIVQQYENQLSTVRSDYTKELNAGIVSIESKEYRLAEMSNGKPTSLAKKIREDEISEFKERKNAELEQQEKLINSLYNTEIQRLYDQIVENCLIVENKTYKISSQKGDLKWSSNTYDGNTYTWEIVLYSPYTESFSYSLSYKTLTGEKPATSISNKEIYNRYINTVEAYDARLKDILNFTADVSVLVDAKEGQLIFEVSKIQAEIKTATENKIDNILISEKMKWSTLGLKMLKYDYSWLLTNKKFNIKADSEINRQEQKTQIEAKQAEIAYKIENTRKEAIETNSTFYGIDRRLVFMPVVRIQSFGLTNKKNNIIRYNLSLDIEYAISGSFSVGIEPCCSFSTNMENLYDTEFCFSVNFSDYITSFCGIGVKAGLSNSGYLFNLYTKVNLGSLTNTMYSSFYMPFIVDIGYGLECSNSFNEIKSSIFMGIGYAF